MFYFVAIKNGKVTPVVAIDRLSIVFATVFAAVFLAEKVSLKTGLAIALMAFAGIIIAMDK